MTQCLCKDLLLKQISRIRNSKTCHVFISISHEYEARQIWALEIMRSPIAHFFISPPHNCPVKTLIKMSKMVLSLTPVPGGSQALSCPRGCIHSISSAWWQHYAEGWATSPEPVEQFFCPSLTDAPLRDHRVKSWCGQALWPAPRRSPGFLASLSSPLPSRFSFILIIRLGKVFFQAKSRNQTPCPAAYGLSGLFFFFFLNGGKKNRQENMASYHLLNAHFDTPPIFLYKEGTCHSWVTARGLKAPYYSRPTSCSFGGNKLVPNLTSENHRSHSR